MPLLQRVKMHSLTASCFYTSSISILTAPWNGCIIWTNNFSIGRLTRLPSTKEMMTRFLPLECWSHSGLLGGRCLLSGCILPLSCRARRLSTILSFYLQQISLVVSFVAVSQVVVVDTHTHKLWRSDGAIKWRVKYNSKSGQLSLAQKWDVVVI